MTASSKSKAGIGFFDVLRVLKPLLLLIIPVIILVCNHFFLAEHYPEIAKWVRYTAYFFAGIIGFWVLVRLVIFFRGLLYLWRNEREVMRRDPLYVVETKMRARLKAVHSKLKRKGLRPYDIPFYAVLGQKKGSVDALLSGCGIAFPKDLNEKTRKDQAESYYEEWHIGNEAVFVDISTLLLPQKNDEWHIFLKTLENLRPSAPINGLIIALSIEHFRDRDVRLKRDEEASLQKNLQLIQDRLQEKYPVYLVVSEIEGLTGFSEFFEDLDRDAQGQILGWSGANSFKEPLKLETLSEDIAKIKSNIEAWKLRKMAAQHNTQKVDLIYTFVEEFNGLLRSVSDFIGRVFDPDAYLDSVSIRGFYFVGFRSSALQLSGGDLPIGRQTVIGEGRNLRMDIANAKVANLEINCDSHHWFCRDLFFKKLIPEAGVIYRPGWVQKKQTILKATAAAIVVLQLVLVGWLLLSETGKSSDWREESALVIKHASLLLSVKNPEKHDEATAGQILDEILRIKESMTKQGLFNNATSIGLGSEVADKLDNLHYLIYQKYFLEQLIRKVESDISKWDGTDSDFSLWGRKIIEYVKWSNPKYKGKLSIEPFVSIEKDALSTKHRNFLLRHFAQVSTDAIPRMTDNNTVARISKALEQVNGSTRITIPLESGVKRRLPGESEWEWWQRVSSMLMGFSDTTKRLLKVESPFLNRQQGDITDRIFAANKMVGQLMNSITAMENIIEEGEGKYATWISSLKEFFPDMKTAASEWPPILDVIDKCEMRSEFAYDKIVVPLLNQEMAWLQTFLGLKNDKLTSLLDTLVKNKTSVGSRQIEIYRGIGQRYLTFLKSFNSYLAGLGELIQKQGALVSYSTYYSGEELMKKLEFVKKDLADLGALENKFVESAAVLDGILADIEKKELEKDTQDLNLKDAKKDIVEMGKSALADAVSGDELKRQVLTKFNWSEFSNWLKNWQPGLKVEKNYLASLYWVELFDWFKPFTKNQMKGGSYGSILRMNLFMEKNAQFFTEDIEKFLDGWLLSVPVELESLLKDSQAMQLNPGLRDFDILYGQVKKFKEQYLAGLRQAAALFVSAVNLMDQDAQKTLRKLTEGADPELNWNALNAFSKFKQEYEIKEGVALRNITGSLEEVQIALSKTLNGELGKKFEFGWNAVVKKMRESNIDTRFPFFQDGPSASKDEVLRTLSAFVDLGVSVGVIKADDGTAIELNTESKKIMDQIVPTARRNFIEQCAVFKNFLSGENERLPEVVVVLTPGEIGKHYHWVRMFVGKLRYYDLNVYGEKQVTIDLSSSVGGVKFAGLDVSKSSLSEQTITKGDLGLLQLAYKNGRSVDKEKTKWRVISSLSSSSSGGEQISFELIFKFSAPLPLLPILPG